MSYKYDDCRPSLRGTWTATLPQEFFCHPEHCEPKHEPCSICCSNPCCPHEKEEPKEEHEEHCEPRKKECCCVKTSSSTGGAGPITPSPTTATLNVVSTAVNTCCIGQTDNLISFSTNVVFSLALTLNLTFQVVRTSCFGTSVAIGPTYSYIRTVTAAGSENYSFQFVDQDVAPGTYTYSVQVLPGAFTTAGSANLLNATLTVTATADD